jgi:hypothetical protein
MAKKIKPDPDVEVRLVDGNYVGVSRSTGDIVFKEGVRPATTRKRAEPIWAGHGREFPMTQTLCDEVCDLLTGGEPKTLKQVERELGLPDRLLYKYRRECKQFRDRCDEALKDRAFAIHEKVLEDMDEVPNKNDAPGERLRFDKLKWAAEVGDPDRFGKKREDAPDRGPRILIINTGVPKEERLEKKEALDVAAEVLDAETADPKPPT